MWIDEIPVSGRSPYRRRLIILINSKLTPLTVKNSGPAGPHTACRSSHSVSLRIFSKMTT